MALTGVRKYLNDNGFSNAQIGYDPTKKVVTLQGKNFISATPQSNGSTYSTAEQLAAALKQYQGANSPTVSPTTSPTNSPSTADMLSKSLSAPQTSTQPFQFTSPAPFTYDANTDPAYQAALKLAQSNASTDQNNTLAKLQSLGQGNSSYSETLANQIGQKAVSDVATQTLPQLLADAYQRYSDQATRDYNNKLANYNMSQDAISNARNAANDKANYTGNYTSPADAAIQKQMAANSAAYATATPAEQNRLHTENMQLAKQLGETYDLKTGTYSVGNATVRTIAGQTLDENKAQDLATLTGKMPDGTPTNAAQQQILQNEWTLAEQTGTIPNDLANFYGLPHGTQTAAAKQAALQNSIAQQNANSSTQNANTSAKNANTSAVDSINSQVNATTSANEKSYQDAFNNLQSLYTAKDPYTGTISVTNPQALRAAILTLNFTDAKGNPDDAATSKMLTAFGLPVNP